MKFPLLNIDGSKADSIELSDKFVKLKVNHKLIKFVIDWQLNHLKPRTAKTKEMKSKDLQKKLYLKRVAEAQDMPVKRLHYLLVVELLMAQKVWRIKLKKLIKK